MIVGAKVSAVDEARIREEIKEEIKQKYALEMKETVRRELRETLSDEVKVRVPFVIIRFSKTDWIVP